MFSLDAYRSAVCVWVNNIEQLQIEFPDAKEYVFVKSDFAWVDRDGRDHVRVANMSDYVVKKEYTICQRVLIAIVCIIKRVYYRLKCENDVFVQTALDNMGSVALRNRFTRVVCLLIRRQNVIEIGPFRSYQVFGYRTLKELNDKIQPKGWWSWSSKESKNVLVRFKTFWEESGDIPPNVRKVIDKETKITKGMKENDV